MVATDVPGVRTVVENCVTGIVVEVADVDAMVRAVAELVGDDELRRTMGGAARRRCLERFGLAAVAERWLDLLSPLLPASARPDTTVPGTGPGPGPGR